MFAVGHTGKGHEAKAMQMIIDLAKESGKYDFMTIFSCGWIFSRE